MQIIVCGVFSLHTFANICLYIYCHVLWERQLHRLFDCNCCLLALMMLKWFRATVARLWLFELYEYSQNGLLHKETLSKLIWWLWWWKWLQLWDFDEDTCRCSLETAEVEVVVDVEEETNQTTILEARISWWDLADIHAIGLAYGAQMLLVLLVRSANLHLD